MQKFTLTFLTITLLGIFSAFTPVQAPTPTAAPTWTLDKVHSSVNFNIRHFFSDVAGSFDTFDGQVAFDPADLAGSSVTFSVDVASVDTKNDSRDGHLQSPDFFDAASHPKMTFKSTEIKKGKEEKVYDVTGQLTIRDVTKTVTIPVQFLGAMENPMKPSTYVGGFKTSFSLNRTEYQVGTGDWAATAVIGDEVDININLEVNR